MMLTRKSRFMVVENKGGDFMAWTYTLTQQTDDNGDLIPLYTVTQWNTDNTNQKYESTITEKVKEICYD